MRKKIDKKTKITYLVDFFRTISAGTEKQLGYLLTHLPELNYSVQLISLQDSPFLKDEAPILFPKVAINTLGAQSDVSKSLPALAHLYLLLRSSKPGIVHTFFPTSNSFGVLISRFAGIPTIVSSRRDMGYNLNKKDIVFLKIANRFVSCIVANARAVREHAIKVEGIKKEKMQVIYNGISFDDYNRSSHTNIQKEPIIGIVANLNRPVKRVDLFIKAAAIINQNFPDVKFWIVGDGPLRIGLEQLASNLGLNSNVVFLGHQREIRMLFNKMTVGVICSDSEGFSNTIMEYMAYGIPVVATRVGGNTELVEHKKTGFLVPPGDHELLAIGIMRYLQHNDIARKMGLAGKNKILENFSENIMIQATKDIYEALVVT